jgi:hypothetical protein
VQQVRNPDSVQTYQLSLVFTKVGLFSDSPRTFEEAFAYVKELFLAKLYPTRLVCEMGKSGNARDSRHHLFYFLFFCESVLFQADVHFHQMNTVGIGTGCLTDSLAKESHPRNSQQ